MATDTEITEPDAVLLHRVERFVDLGFGANDSFALGEAKGGNGYPLYWGDVKKLLSKGATHAQIVAIYADEAH